MRIFIVSFWFPPTNTIGAVRVGKFAKYLHEAGHEIRVLTARFDDNLTLPLEIPAELVTATGFYEVDRLFDPLTERIRRVLSAVGLRRAAPRDPAGGAGAGPPAAAEGPIERTLKRHYYAMVQVPDSRIGWLPRALTAGRALLRGWRPDVMMASAPPFTSLMVARRLSREFGVPWVAELRDLWVENVYYSYPGWRRALDRVLERRTLGSAAGLVTVTPLWGRDLQRHYRQPLVTILNGYAEEDLVHATPPPSDTVSIVYTGNIYAGYRDPSPLFAALALIGARRDKVAVEFYGPTEADILPLTERYGVTDRVFVRPRVSYRESLAIQATADVLLLLQWNHVKDEGNIPAKFFEYLAARRPILLIGYDQGTLAQMVRERNAGVVSSVPETIAQHLSRWIDERGQGIPALDAAVYAGLSRAEQFRAYERFLAEHAAHRPGEDAGKPR